MWMAANPASSLLPDKRPHSRSYAIDEGPSNFVSGITDTVASSPDNDATNAARLPRELRATRSLRGGRAGSVRNLMISQLFPRSADNTYHGHKPALWLFGLVIVMRVVMSLNSVLNTHTTARYADGIPLHT